jgi:uncharacterized membrane protein
MPDLTVWGYATPLGAEAGEVRLRRLTEREALTVHDAIAVTWMRGAHQPHIGQLRHATAASAGRGSVLGAMVGMLVLAPAAGAAGAGIAAVAQRLRGTGIDAHFLEQIVALLEPGSSALLVLSTDADLDVVRPAIERSLARGDVVLLHAELDPDAPEAIREAMEDMSAQRPGTHPHRP